jgi:ABC-type sugar transport system ATPase subunit
LAVLLMSSEPEQLVEHCHRVLAVNGGRIVDELNKSDLTYSRVSKWAIA